MNKPISAAILQALLDGLDPVTGETLSEDHVLQHPAVIRALHTAVMTLEGAQVPQSIVLPTNPHRDNAPTLRSGRLSSKRPWTQEDLDELRIKHQAGWTAKDLARHFQRRERGILRQLEGMGLIEPSELNSRRTQPGLERAGLPWTPNDDALLEQMFNDKAPIAEIAAELKRSEYAVFCHMEKLELYGDEPGYLQFDPLPKWTYADQLNLKRLFKDGKTIPELALHFGRTEKSIAARLFYMGLNKDASFSPLPHRE